jgi:murein L,D-transpeptidase YcbB/YkuD
MTCARRRPGRALAAAIAGLLIFRACSRVDPPPPAKGAAAALRLILSGENEGLRTSGGIALDSGALLIRFYERRGGHPAWSGGGGVLPAASSLVSFLNGVEEEGLNPDDYHAGAIAALMGRLASSDDGAEEDMSRELADLDVLLTDAFLAAGRHLEGGRLDARTLETARGGEWPESDGPAALEAALARGTVRETLAELAPKHEQYVLLRDAYRALRRLESDAVLIDGSGENGPYGADPGAGILGPALAAALDLDLSERAGRSEAGGALTRRIERFRRRAGLSPRGGTDGEFVRALNGALAALRRRLDANLERWRWLRNDLGGTHVLVDTAAFVLRLVRDGRTLMSMKVVVGKETWPTPVFSSEIKAVVFNPVWNTPPRVLRLELGNSIRDDPKYLETNAMKLFLGWGAEEREVARDEVDWTKEEWKELDLHLRQYAGPANVLGRIKFDMPNVHDVFLHDTPYRDDFQRDVRLFSHGCIRAEQPVDLAEFMLRGRGWSRERILAAMEAGKEGSVPLGAPLDIHVAYITALAEPDGRIRLRRDVYGRDGRIERALLRRPPP